MSDTIFALSSGAPPAAIGVIRVSGPAASTTGRALAGTLPVPRQATVRTLRDAAGGILDRALVLWFPGPATATGEDLLELHVHGGKAVVAAVLGALSGSHGLRHAEPGEFTRRALVNGRIDLSQAEGLADLLSGETETARRAAVAAADGAVSRAVGRWRDRLVALSAQLEAQIDFADEDDVAAEADALATIADHTAALRAELAAAAGQPPVERLHDGLRVVLAGPPNSGKSTLINALAGRDVAIATPIAGTTRDVIEAPVQRGGRAWLLTDTAGLRRDSDDPIERIGIARTEAAIGTADIVIWMGDDPAPDPAMLSVHARCDEAGRGTHNGRLAVSGRTVAGLDELWCELDRRADSVSPAVDAVGWNRRQIGVLAQTATLLREQKDPILSAEQLRLARSLLGTIVDAVDTEAVFDALFSRFCLGK